MAEPLQGSQRAAFDQAIEKAAIEWVKRTELRKWAMSHALDIFAKGPIPNPEKGSIFFTSPVALAKEIYDFVRTE